MGDLNVEEEEVFVRITKGTGVFTGVECRPATARATSTETGSGESLLFRSSFQ